MKKSFVVVVLKVKKDLGSAYFVDSMSFNLKLKYLKFLFLKFQFTICNINLSLVRKL
jgi:hypothetical protein